jgi:hypothetical protein
VKCQFCVATRCATSVDATHRMISTAHVRLQVLTVEWLETPCNMLLDASVSKDLAASIFRVILLTVVLL